MNGVEFNIRTATIIFWNGVLSQLMIFQQSIIFVELYGWGCVGRYGGNAINFYQGKHRVFRIFNEHPAGSGATCDTALVLITTASKTIRVVLRPNYGKPLKILVEDYGGLSVKRCLFI
ncbi:hypothetical protein CW304_04320 [Bacillus sp. UFRGS-B20]|nr:hypothetical protein CW304_04320 [Bacillus sp. UFRGS-B20]